MSLAEFQFGPFAVEDSHVFMAQVVGFVLLALLLWFVNVPVLSRPHLRGLLVDREARVEEAHNQVELALSDTQRLHDDYAIRLKNIEVESRERIDAAVKEATAVHNEIISDASNVAALVVRRTEEELARELARHRILLRRQIVQFSLDAAEGAVGALTNDAVQRKLIDEFIARASVAQTKEAAANG